MNHYTLNTGHNRVSPRSEVADDVLPQMSPLLQPGEHSLGSFGEFFAGYRLVVPVCEAGYAATLYGGELPLLTIGVAATEADADAIWPALESMYLEVTEAPGMRSADFAAPHQPPTPWCAVVLVHPPDVPNWAGDFERCLAWTWIAENEGQ